MKFVFGALTAIAICLSFAAHAGEGYEIKGRSEVAHWQQNLNTGLRRWLVNCGTSNLFSNGRECM